MFNGIPTIRGAYGRTYKNRKSIIADWESNKDFQDAVTGQYLNLEDCKRGNISTVNVRYNSDRSVLPIKIDVSSQLRTTAN